MELTETFATLPAASVSGLYLHHPEARYFSIGRVARDQVEDYAARKGIEVAEAERWLTPEPGVQPAGRCRKPGYPVGLERAPARRSLLFRDENDDQERNRPLRGRGQRKRPRGPAAGDPLAGQALRAAAEAPLAAGRSPAASSSGCSRSCCSSRSAAPAARTSTTTRASSQVDGALEGREARAEAPRPAEAEPAGDRARRRLRPPPRRRRSRPLRHADAAARRPEAGRRLDLDAVVPARPRRRRSGAASTSTCPTGSTTPTRSAAPRARSTR